MLLKLVFLIFTISMHISFTESNCRYNGGSNYCYLYTCSDKFLNLMDLAVQTFLKFSLPQSFTNLTRPSQLYVHSPAGSLTRAFRGITSLISIDLTDIRYAFHGLTRLYHLGLEGNRISVLEENIFKDLKSLTYLDLDGNGIREVSDEAFNGLTALKYLSLSGNPLFPLNTLYKLNALIALYINYNSYRVCECAQRMSDETCVNTVGNYACRESGCVQSCENPQDHSCTCCDGFCLYNNSQCINECPMKNGDCDELCMKSDGSYTCASDGVVVIIALLVIALFILLTIGVDVMNLGGPVPPMLQPGGWYWVGARG